MRSIRIKAIAIVKHPFFSGSAILMIAGMSTNVVNYLYHLLMGRTLGPAKYGELASLYSILYIISIIPLSSSVSIVKFISEAKTKKELAVIHEGVRIFLTKIGIVGGVLVLILSPLIGSFLHIEDIVSIAIIGPSFFFFLVTLVNQSSLQGILKFTGVAVPNFVSSVTKLIVGIGLVIAGLSVRGAMIGVLIGAGLAYFVSIWFKNGHFALVKTGKFNLRGFLKYSAPVLFQSIAFTCLFTADVLLVKHFFPPFEAGIYSALSTLGKIIFFAASPIASAMFPFVSGRKVRGEKYFRIVAGSLGITMVIIFIGLAGFYLFPDLAIGVLYGKDYLVAKGDLVWMGLFIGFYTISNLLVNFFLAVDKTRIVLVPVSVAILQIILIWNFHPTLLAVIQMSLMLMVVQFLVLIIYLGCVKLASEKTYWKASTFSSSSGVPSRKDN